MFVVTSVMKKLAAVYNAETFLFTSTNIHICQIAYYVSSVTLNVAIIHLLNIAVAATELTSEHAVLKAIQEGDDNKMYLSPKALWVVKSHNHVIYI